MTLCEYLVDEEKEGEDLDSTLEAAQKQTVPAVSEELSSESKVDHYAVVYLT